MRTRYCLVCFHSYKENRSKNVVILTSLSKLLSFAQVIMPYLSRSTTPSDSTRTKRDGGVLVGTVPPS